MLRPACDVSIVVPTRNEAANIEALLDELAAVVGVLAWRTEVLVVDDSDDGTERVARSWSQAHHSSFPVTILHRPQRQRVGGLGGAVVAGLRAATGTYVCVMDGDLQHPPAVVADLVAALGAGADLAIASRFIAGGGGSGLSKSRHRASIATRDLARTAFAAGLGNLTDPLSGFFAFRRDAIDVDCLRPKGFKILMELVLRHPGLKTIEVPFVFGHRAAGRSKAGVREALRYVAQLLELRRSLRSRHLYDVHGIVGIDSAAPLPELESFRVTSLERATVRVDIGRLRRRPIQSTSSFSYRECFGRLGFAVDIDRSPTGMRVTASRLLRRSPHVLYTNVVEPIIRWSVGDEGYALVHAACVSDGDRATFITARTDTGKTTTMLKLLSADSELAFVSDDLVLVDETGGVLPYPKPLTISAHTLRAVPDGRLTRRERARLSYQSRIHSRLGRRIGFALDVPGLPIATANALLQVLVPPPKFPIERLVPTATIAKAAVLERLCVIQRGRERHRLLAAEDAAVTLLENCEDAYGFPPYPALAAFLLGAARVQADRETTVIRSALAGIETHELSSNSYAWADRIADLIDEARNQEASVIDLRDPGTPGSADAAEDTVLRSNAG